MDIVKILGLGVVGLGFLLAYLAYRLLSQAQLHASLAPGAFRAIYYFMTFSFALSVLGLASQFFNGHPTTSGSDAFVAVTTSDVAEFANAQATHPYPTSGYPNDADKLESLIQEFLAHVLLHSETPIAIAKPFYLAMDLAVNEFEERARANLNPADPSLEWHAHTSPEWPVS